MNFSAEQAAAAEAELVGGNAAASQATVVMGADEQHRMIETAVAAMPNILEQKDKSTTGASAAASPTKGKGRSGGDGEEGEEVITASPELLARLWAQLAESALSHSMLKWAQHCCASCTAAIPEDALGRADITKAGWRWFAVGNCVWGSTVEMLIAPALQEESVQTSLREKAIVYYNAAIRCAALASSWPTAQTAACKLWNCALPLLATFEGRIRLEGSIKSALMEMSQISRSRGAETDADLSASTQDVRVVLAMYKLLAQSLQEQGRLSEALRIVTDATKRIPAELDNDATGGARLLDIRIMILASMNQDVRQDLGKKKASNNPRLKAQTWISLARSAGKPETQIAAYSSAIDVLRANADDPAGSGTSSGPSTRESSKSAALDGFGEYAFDRALILVELSEWMLAHSESRRDVCETLLEGADVLRWIVHHDVTVAAADAEERARIDTLKVNDALEWDSVQGGSAGGLGEMNASVELTPTVPGGRSMSVFSPSSTYRETPRPTRSPGNTPAAGGGSSTPGSRGRSFIGGATPMSSRFDLNGLGGKVAAFGAVKICHFDTLVRVLSQLAQLAQSAAERTQYALAATWYGEMMLRSAVSAVTPEVAAEEETVAGQGVEEEEVEVEAKGGKKKKGSSGKAKDAGKKAKKKEEKKKKGGGKKGSGKKGDDAPAPAPEPEAEAAEDAAETVLAVTLTLGEREAEEIALEARRASEDRRSSTAASSSSPFDLPAIDVAAGWCEWKASAPLVAAWKEAAASADTTMRGAVFCSGTESIAQLSMTVHHLTKLANLLADIGHPMHAIKIHALISVLAVSCISEEATPLVALMHLRSSRYLFGMNLPKSASVHRSFAGSLSPPVAQVKVWIASLSASKPRDDAAKTSSTPPNVAAVSFAWQPLDLDEQSYDIGAVLVATASELLDLGEIATASHLLAVVATLNGIRAPSAEDSRLCALLQGEVALHQGKIDDLIDALTSVDAKATASDVAQTRAGDDAAAWRSAVLRIQRLHKLLQRQACLSREVDENALLLEKSNRAEKLAQSTVVGGVIDARKSAAATLSLGIAKFNDIATRVVENIARGVRDVVDRAVYRDAWIVMDPANQGWVGTVGAAKVSKALRDSLSKRLIGFKTSTTQRRISFPSTLLVEHRKFVHVTATLMGFTSRSNGKGDDRTITCFKKKDEHSRALALAGFGTIACQATCDVVLSELALATAKTLAVDTETRVAALMWQKAKMLVDSAVMRMVPSGTAAIAVEAALARASMYNALPMQGVDSNGEAVVVVPSDTAATLRTVREAVAAAKLLCESTQAGTTPTPLCTPHTRMLAAAHIALGDALTSSAKTNSSSGGAAAASPAASFGGSTSPTASTQSTEGGSDNGNGSDSGVVAAWLLKTGAQLKPMMAAAGDGMDSMDQAWLAYASAATLLASTPALSAVPLAAMARVTDAVRREALATPGLSKSFVVWTQMKGRAVLPSGDDDQRAELVSSQDALCLSLYRAMRHERLDVAAASALDLVESYGASGQARLAALALAVHQSCSMRAELLKLFCAATAPMSGQRVAILLREHLFRSRQHIPSPAALPAFRAIDASLTTRSVAWRRINAPLSAMPVQSLFASAAESIELLPAELEIVTLQHADNGGVLYISRVRSGAPDLSAAEAEQAAEGGEQGGDAESAAGAGDVDAADTTTSGVTTDCVAKVRWSAAQRAELTSLVDDARTFAALSPKYLRAMHQLEGDNTVSDEEDIAETALQAIVVRMTALLGPLVRALGDFAGSHVMILPDRALASLPLEALACFTNVGSCARDLSLAVALQRLVDATAAAGSAAGSGGGGGVTAKSSAFGFIADPRLEDEVDADYAPEQGAIVLTFRLGR